MSSLRIFVFAILAGTLSLSYAAPAQRPDSLASKKGPVQASDTTKRAHFGRLVVTTTPPAADVSVDSLSKGQGTVTVDSLVPGSHTIIVKALGYFGKKITVDVQADSVLNLPVTLVLPARLVVESQPAGATAVFDGKEIGVTPCDISRVKPGDHTVKLEKAGYISLEKSVTSTEGKTDTLSAALQQVVSPPPPAQKPAAPPANKKHFDKIAALVAVGAFVVFGLVLLGVEIHEAAQ